MKIADLHQISSHLLFPFQMLQSKLNKGACNLKSAILYDGSILEVDSRLHDIDIGTCLEVPFYLLVSFIHQQRF